MLDGIATHWKKKHDLIYIANYYVFISLYIFERKYDKPSQISDDTQNADDTPVEYNQQVVVDTQTDSFGLAGR